MDYKFKDIKLCVFTWHGCVLQVEGTPTVAYLMGETPMITYVNTHAGLDSFRTTALAKGDIGPRCLICGPQDCGKTSLARILTNYAVRADWKPLLVDLDPCLNSLAVPGTLSASLIEHHIAPGATTVHHTAPVTYFYGQLTPAAAPTQYDNLVSRLAADVQTRLERADPRAKASGVIIDSTPWVRDGFAGLVHACAAFEVDIILVVGQDLLMKQLREEKQLAQVTVAKLAKSGGVVAREPMFRGAIRRTLIREYFYGPENIFRPSARQFSFTDLKIFRTGNFAQAPASALPLGSIRQIDPNRPQLVKPGLDLRHRLLAVLYARSEAEVATANVAGFVHVQEVDVSMQTLNVLVPCLGALPSVFCLVGAVTWTDSSD